MFGERNIRLGCGEQSVTCQGTSIVVTEEARDGLFFKEERFDCRAMLCESREELQKKFTQEVSLNASAAGSELSTNATISREIGKDNFDSFYMLVIECIEGHRELNVCGEAQQILLPDVQKEIATLQTVEDWEEFYRTKGDRVVFSTVIGSKIVILISLKNKKIQKDLITVLQAKLASPTTLSGAAGIAAKLQEQLSLLGRENISSVEVHSLGDSNPDFMRLIEQIGALKMKLAQFVNADSTEASKSPGDLGKDEPHHTNGAVGPEGKGRILAFSSCSYIDLLPENIRKEVEGAYDQFLRRTNRAAKYMATISKVYSRANILSNLIDYYFEGHQGAFTYDVDTELAGTNLKNMLVKYKDQLTTLSDEVVREISGLSVDHKLRQEKSLRAHACFGLKKDISALYASSQTRDFYKIVNEQMELVEEFFPLVHPGDQQYLLPLKERYAKILQIFKIYHTNEDEILTKLISLGLEIYNFFLKDVSHEIIALENLIGFYNENFANFISRGEKERVERNWVCHSETLLQLLKPFQKKSGCAAVVNAGINCEPLGYLINRLQQIKPEQAHGTKKGVDSLSENRRETVDLLDMLGKALAPWQALLATRIKLQAFLTKYGVSHDSSNIEDAFKLLFSMQTLCAQLFKTQSLGPVFSANCCLYADFMQMKVEFLQALTINVEACRLKKTDIIAIEKTCQHFLEIQRTQDSAEQWWKEVWKKITAIAKKLDFIATNTVPNHAAPPQVDMYGKIYAVIDFKKAAFRLGTLEIARHKWFKKEMFSGKKYIKLSVPIEATNLRIQFADAAQFPENSLTFNIERKSAIQMDDRHAKHRTLHKNLLLGGPIIPRRLAKVQIFNIMKRLTSDKALFHVSDMLHAANENIVYKKVRVKNAYFNQRLDNGVTSLRLNVFAEMGYLGKGLEPLCLGEDMPVGEAYYGFCFRWNATSDDDKYARTNRRKSSPTGLDSSENSSVGIPSFMHEFPRGHGDSHQKFFDRQRPIAQPVGRQDDSAISFVELRPPKSDESTSPIRHDDTSKPQWQFYDGQDIFLRK
mgnify:CR=1 FL=1